jgi:hypothetical protein
MPAAKQHPEKVSKTNEPIPFPTTETGRAVQVIPLLDKLRLAQNLLTFFCQGFDKSLGIGLCVIVNNLARLSDRVGFDGFDALDS